MKIMVTGAAGFIGSHLVDHLLERGDTVVGVDNFNDYYNPSEKRANCAEHCNHERYTLIETDIREYDSVLSAVETHKPDTLVHLAARAGVRPSIEEPLLYGQVNIQGTLNLFEASRLQGVKNIVFASSSSVYGNNEKVPFSEDDSVDNPISPYAASKKAGELLAHTYHHLYDLPITCLRFFTVYGPRQRPDLAIRKFMELIEADQPIEIYGDGSMRRDFTFIDDIVRGIMAAIDKPQGYEIINLGNSSPISVTDLVTAIQEALGKEAKITYTSEQAGDVIQTYADTTKAERLLGFAPNTPLSEGLATMVSWLRNR